MSQQNVRVTNLPQDLKPVPTPNAVQASVTGSAVALVGKTSLYGAILPVDSTGQRISFYVMVKAEGGALGNPLARYWTDGTVPDANTGMLLRAGDTIYFNDGEASGCKMIAVAGASPVIQITLYKGR